MRGAANAAAAPMPAFSRSRLRIGVSSPCDPFGGNLAIKPVTESQFRGCDIPFSLLFVDMREEHLSHRHCVAHGCASQRSSLNTGAECELAHTCVKKLTARKTTETALPTPCSHHG